MPAGHEWVSTLGSLMSECVEQHLQRVAAPHSAAGRTMQHGRASKGRRRPSPGFEGFDFCAAPDLTER